MVHVHSHEVTTSNFPRRAPWHQNASRPRPRRPTTEPRPHRLAHQTMSSNEASTPAPTHEPPSLPSSPLPKRTKIISPAPLDQAATLPRTTDSGTATPTPLASSSMSALQPPAPIAPSIAAGAAAEQALQVLLLSETARAPTKGSAFAAGHDLYSARDTVIPARGRAIVATDISISVPVGTCTSFNCALGG